MDYYSQIGVGMAMAVYTIIIGKTLSYCMKRHDECPPEKPTGRISSNEDLKESLKLT